jgi:hypothetical protein
MAFKKSSRENKRTLVSPQSLTQLSLGLLSLLGGHLLLAKPASAAFVSLLNPVIGGDSLGTPPFVVPTIPPNTNNAILRCSNSDIGTIPVGNVVPCFTAGGSTLEQVLQGQPGAPGGHVELNSIANSTYDFTKFTSLSGTLNGKDFLVRSTTQDDWFSNNNQLTRHFLTSALQTNGFDPKFLQPDNFDILVDTFINRGGPQRFADPNITYVLADDATGDLTLGMAGTLNASNLLKAFFSGVVDPADIPDVVQVSEVAYVAYNNPGYFFASGGAVDPFGTSGQSANDFGLIPGCDGGAADGLFDYPEAGCSYSADFQVTDVVGATPQTPVLPGTVDPVTNTNTFTNQQVVVGEPIWFDPPVAIGYEFIVTSGPDFSSIQLLPRLGSGPGSNQYTLFGDSGNSCNPDDLTNPLGTATGGVTFTFNPSVRCFLVTGIDEGLGLPADRYQPGQTGTTTPFPVELTFTETGTVTFTQTPVVPEPLTLLGASAAIGMGSFFKRRSVQSRKK